MEYENKILKCSRVRWAIVGCVDFNYVFFLQKQGCQYCIRPLSFSLYSQTVFSCRPLCFFPRSVLPPPPPPEFPLRIEADQQIKLGWCPQKDLGPSDTNKQNKHSGKVALHRDVLHKEMCRKSYLKLQQQNLRCNGSRSRSRSLSSQASRHRLWLRFFKPKTSSAAHLISFSSTVKKIIYKNHLDLFCDRTSSIFMTEFTNQLQLPRWVLGRIRCCYCTKRDERARWVMAGK